MRHLRIYLLTAMMMVSLTIAACGKNAAAGNSGTETENTAPWAETERAVTLAKPDKNAPLADAELHETNLLGSGKTSTFSLTDVPEYSGDPYIVIHGNVPYFSESERTATSFESYSDLDRLGRCGAAYASIGTDLMPTEERGKIGQVKPSGWHTIKYDCIDGMYLYNRCHLIGYQLAGENANVKNLITGTRYLNVTGMLPFENLVTDYVKETGNHVMYRVTPVFDGNNLVASGVLMEGESVEDDGAGIQYCVYVYNVQPGITIDYATGDSCLTEGETSGSDPLTEARTAQENNPTTETQAAQENNSTTENPVTAYILNTNSKKFHNPSCSSVDQMKDKNKKSFTGTRDEAIAQGYAPCGRCNP